MSLTLLIMMQQLFLESILLDNCLFISLVFQLSVTDFQQTGFRSIKEILFSQALCLSAYFNCDHFFLLLDEVLGRSDSFSCRLVNSLSVFKVIQYLSQYTIEILLMQFYHSHPAQACCWLISVEKGQGSFFIPTLISFLYFCVNYFYYVYGYFAYIYVCLCTHVCLVWAPDPLQLKLQIDVSLYIGAENQTWVQTAVIVFSQ